MSARKIKTGTLFFLPPRKIGVVLFVRVRCVNVQSLLIRFFESGRLINERNFEDAQVISRESL